MELNPTELDKNMDCIDFPELYFHSKLYPMWTNFIYAAISLYSAIKAVKYGFIIWCPNNEHNIIDDIKLVIFSVFSIWALITTVFSFIYHGLSPSSHICNDYQFDNEEYKKALTNDEFFSQGLAIGSFVIVGIVFFSKLTAYFRGTLNKLDSKIKYNPYTGIIINAIDGQDILNVIFAIGFIVGGYKCFYKAVEYYKKARECKTTEDISVEECRKEYLNVYNMYHSFWHILTGFAGFFWILLVDSL